MRNKILKFLVTKEVQERGLMVPTGTTVLTVAEQKERMYVWVEMNPEQNCTCLLELRVIFTGSDVPEGFKHLYSSTRDNWVRHFYYRIDANPSLRKEEEDAS